MGRSMTVGKPLSMMLLKGNYIIYRISQDYPDFMGKQSVRLYAVRQIFYYFLDFGVSPVSFGGKVGPHR